MKFLKDENNAVFAVREYPEMQTICFMQSEEEFFQLSFARMSINDYERQRHQHCRTITQDEYLVRLKNALEKVKEILENEMMEKVPSLNY